MMRVISSAEFNGNIEMYANLVKDEDIIVQNEENESYNLKDYIKTEPDEDLARGIPAEDFLELVLKDIREMYKLPR